ncbi:MAG: radical SAM family heme chaperone HemW [Clostridia bacterium]|nr:radical SAM family heme chaperone HemW [Clostridia bacterium]
MMESRKLGIYVHIPFCERKCNYCDFISYDKIPDLTPAVPFSMDAKRAYVSALREELRARRKACGGDYHIDSLYYGGGTPTTVDIDSYKELNDAISLYFTLCEDAEITIEANPETVDVQKAQKIQVAGFNRISLGVQSLDDNILKRLGRIHHAQKAEQSFKLLRGITQNINVDLMFGVPGQTFSIWKETLERVLDWEPEHLSFYSLQLEEGTPFYQNYRKGEMEIPVWEENRSMYHFAVERVQAAGYKHYEISNAAKPGFECRHNIKYWTMQEYMGLGVSAHSYMNRARSANPSEMDSYERFKAEGFPFQKYKMTQDRSGIIGDYLFTELRLVKGFPLKDYMERFQSDFLKDYAHVLQPLFLGGFIEASGGYICLSKKGLDHTNSIMETLLNA